MARQRTQENASDAALDQIVIGAANLGISADELIARLSSEDPLRGMLELVLQHSSERRVGSADTKLLKKMGVSWDGDNRSK